MGRDIVKVAKNVRGRDVVIADLHGNNGCLQSVINQYAPRQGDRLFIAGDLVDRGADSVGVIETILRNPGKVYAIRGNHEEMTLKSIDAIGMMIAFMRSDDKIDEQSDLKGKFFGYLSNVVYEQDASEEMRWLASLLLNHLDHRNGGQWLVDLFFREYADGMVVVDEQGNLLYDSESKIKMIYDYMDNLPYILQVEGVNPLLPVVNIVHAEMPISDLELERRLKAQQGLTEKEKDYAMWARAYDPEVGRTMFSQLVLCGHTIIGLKPEDCLRRETNTVDMDRAAYYTNISVGMDITRASAFMVGAEGESIMQGDVVVAKKTMGEIQNYLKEKECRDEVRGMLINLVEQVGQADFDKVKSIMIKSVDLINEKIEENPRIFTTGRWGMSELLVYSFSDAAIQDELLLKFGDKLVMSVVEDMRDENMTKSHVEEIYREAGVVAEFYNAIRKPAVPVQYNSLVDSMLSPQGQLSVSKMGLFAMPEKEVEPERRESAHTLSRDRSAD